jgi:hypothetical protein
MCVFVRLTDWDWFTHWLVTFSCLFSLSLLIDIHLLLLLLLLLFLSNNRGKKIIFSPFSFYFDINKKHPIGCCPMMKNAFMHHSDYSYRLVFSSINIFFSNPLFDVTVGYLCTRNNVYRSMGYKVWRENIIF